MLALKPSASGSLGSVLPRLAKGQGPQGKLREEEKRMATVEVNPHRRVVVQVRAKYNRRPGSTATEILRRWASQEHLQIEQIEA